MVNKTALIVHSKHTKEYAKLVAKNYRDVEFLEVRRPPTNEVLKIKTDKDVIIGIGGGSVIDTAKVISKDKRVIAIPTTASGSAMTPYATVWEKNKKISVPTKKPIPKNYEFPIKLPAKVLQSTIFDALSHAIESLWSKNATSESKKYSKKAIYLLNKNLKRKNKNIKEIITAGNYAGKAIAITKTNVIHATSYPITIKYNIDHGTACGMLLPYFVKYMDFKELPKLFGFDTTRELVEFLKQSFSPPKIKNLNIKLITNEAIKYKRIMDGPKEITKKDLEKILSNLKK